MLTAFCSVSIPAVLISGGYIFYLPLLGILMLGSLWVRVYQGSGAIPDPWRKYTLSILSILLLASSITFIALRDVAYRQFDSVRYATEQRAAAPNIEQPEHFREIALDLRARLSTLPSQERIVDGSSPDLPDEIRAIRPISVIASDDYITIKMTPDGGALIAYREDSNMVRVNSTQIVPDLFYYPY